MFNPSEEKISFAHKVMDLVLGNFDKVATYVKENEKDEEVLAIFAATFSTLYLVFALFYSNKFDRMQLLNRCAMELTKDLMDSDSRYSFSKN